MMNRRTTGGMPPKGANMNSRGCNPRNQCPLEVTALKGPDLISRLTKGNGLCDPGRVVTRLVFHPGFHPGLFTFHPSGMRQTTQAINAKTGSHFACLCRPK